MMRVVVIAAVHAVDVQFPVSRAERQPKRPEPHRAASRDHYHGLIPSLGYLLKLRPVAYPVMPQDHVPAFQGIEQDRVTLRREEVANPHRRVLQKLHILRPRVQNDVTVGLDALFQQIPEGVVDRADLRPALLVGAYLGKVLLHRRPAAHQNQRPLLFRKAGEPFHVPLHVLPHVGKRLVVRHVHTLHGRQ